jgi:hypothetical protein
MQKPSHQTTHVYCGELADVFKDEREVVFMIALFIPLLSILGVSLVRLNPVPISKLNKHVLFGGLAFALFVVIMGYAQVPYAQEIVFVISLSIVLILLNSTICIIFEKNKICLHLHIIIKVNKR